MRLDIEGANRKPSKIPASINLKVGKRTIDVPDGEYRARVVEIQVQEYFAGKKKTLEFLFEIVEGPHSDAVLRGFANAHYESFTPFTKLYRWHAIAAGDEPEEGDNLDLAVFADKVFLVEVVRKKSRKTDNCFSNVREILGLVCEL